MNLGIATTAVGQGRMAAESMDASLRGETPLEQDRTADIGPDRP